MALELACLFASPLAGAALLALFGHQRFAAELNAAFSIASFLSAARALSRSR